MTEEQITHMYGPRCEEPCESCCTCIVWDMFDKIQQDESFRQEVERIRIMEIIQGRIDTHRNFINYCMDNDVQITPSVFTAIIELRSLLRKIECQ